MDLSSLITVILVLAIIGVALWLIETYLPMPAPIKLLIQVIVVIAVVLYLLSLLGVWHGAAAGGRVLR